MADINTNFKNINKILSLFNPKEKGLVDLLRKELIMAKKSMSGNGSDTTPNGNDSLDDPIEATTPTPEVTNLYGESINELDEMSSAGGGAVSGGMSGAWGKGELTEDEDKAMMSYVEGIFNENKLFNSFYFREYVNKSINEASEGKTVTVNKLTGMNKLEKFLKQNIKSIKESYMDLTTEPGQRASFKAHLLKLISELMETLFINTEASAEETNNFQQENIQEKNTINFKIDQHDGEDGKIVDVDGDGVPDEDNKFSTIPGMDETGKKESVVVYKKLEKQIADPDTGIFANLSNDLDRKVFAKWLLINLSKHMDQWETLFKDLQSDQESESKEPNIDDVI